MASPYQPMSSAPIAPPSNWRLDPAQQAAWTRLVAGIREAGYDVATVGDLRDAFARSRPGDTRTLGQALTDFQRHAGLSRPILRADGTVIPPPGEQTMTSPDTPGRPSITMTMPAVLPPGVPETPAGQAALADLRRHLTGLGHTGLETAEGLTRATLLASGERSPTDYTGRRGDPTLGARDEVAFSSVFSGLMQHGPTSLSPLTRAPNGQPPSSVRCPVVAAPPTTKAAPPTCGH
jgi:hypothetical protein